MAFFLNSKFIIGKYKFTGCNDLVIKKSIHEISDTAVIKLPASAVLKLKKVTTESQQTAKYFRVGNKVNIELGYNGRLHEDFKGFVRRINHKIPVEIECEGYSYILRTTTNIKKSWKKTTLKEVLEYITKDTEITLHPSIPDMELVNLKIDNANGLEVIEYIKGLTKGALTCFFINEVLYMGLAYLDLAKTTVKHQLGWNTIDEADLKYRQAADVKVKIELQYRKATGQQITVSTGEAGGVVKKDTITAISNEATLNEIAKAKLLQENFDGYEGTFTTFLFPYCQPGYRCQLTDTRFEERQGNFFVESVEINYGTNGGRRKIQIGVQLSNL